MNRLEFYKESYYKEIERKDGLEDALNMPLGIVSAVLAGLFYFFTSYDYHLNGSSGLICKVVFLLFMVGASLCVVLAVYFMIVSYNNVVKGHPYKYVDRFVEIDSHYNALKNYHEQNNSSEHLQVDFENFLSDNFRTAVTNNVLQNQIKTAYLHKAKVSLVYGIIGVTLASVFFGYNYYEKDKGEPVHKVIIVKEE